MSTPAAATVACALLIVFAASGARGASCKASITDINSVAVSSTANPPEAAAVSTRSPTVTAVTPARNGTVAPSTGNTTNSTELPQPTPANSTAHPSTAGPQKLTTAGPATPTVTPNGTVNGTTVSPGNSSTTPAHAASTAAAGDVVPSGASSGASGRAFDMVSFVGGVALAVGLQALLFFAYKYFRTRNPRYQHLGDTDAII